MKKSLQSLVLLLMALTVPVTATAAYDQLADGVYMDGTTLYITSGVTSLGDLQVDPSTVYSFAAVPPSCAANTFTGYGATLHIPAASYGAYFTDDYWSNFLNMSNDAVEPTGVFLSESELEVIKGNTYSLTATITPSNASLCTVHWTSTDPSVASVNGGTLNTLAAGECDVIVTCLSMQAVCHVTVIETAVQITLDTHEARLLPNHSLTINLTLDPPLETALKVTSSNPEVAAARLMSGVVQVVGLSEGSTMIVVSSTDGKAIPDSCIITVYTEHGDVNCDGYVNISDITKLIDFLLSDNPEGLSVDNADTNSDGNVNISDVTTLIDYLLSGHWPYSYYDDYWVDLGLPSGTLWATMNIGASSPEDYGDYFAWGETKPKDVYSKENYKWYKSDANGSGYTKYCRRTYSGYNGFADNKMRLDLEDDAAYVNWGPQWRMPTQGQQQELIENCTWTWTAINGVNGQLVTGPNGNSIFLPAAGLHGWGLDGWNGNYFSCNLYALYDYYACYMFFSSDGAGWVGYQYTRENGFTVRAVRASQN